MAEICVIIPCYGFHEVTKKCVDLTLKNAGVPVDIVVVNDGYSPSYLDERVHIINMEKNVGYTNATNKGILWCSDRYKYVHLLNNDTEPYPDFIRELYEVMEKNEKIAIAGSVRVSGTNGDSTNELFGADLIRGFQIFSKEDFNDDFIRCIWFPVCSALISVEALRYVGILDKRMRNHCSDNDLCLRARILGYEIVIVPKSKVYHERELTTKHLNLLPYDDQKIMIEKLSGLPYQRFMNELPLDCEQNVWGRVSFQTYKKDDQVN